MSGKFFDRDARLGQSLGVSSHCCNSSGETASGVENPAVIDLIAHDPSTDSVTLGMIEARPWDGSELQMFQLQEKINAYLSFALDGELPEAYPALAGKPLVLQLDCAEVPPEPVQQFLKVVSQQISLQGIKLRIRVMGGGCGEGCGCAGSAN